MNDLSLTLYEIQKICVQMLRDIVEVCEDEDIPYYAIYGTLLGAIRHDGPIPWDPDVDLYVPENELSRFLSAVSRRLSDKYWVDFRNRGIVPKPFPRIGLNGFDTETLHIDIFRMSGLPNGRIKQLLVTKKGRLLWVLWKAKTINPKEYYSERIKIFSAFFIKILTFPFTVNRIIRSIDKMCEKYDLFETDYVGRVMGQGAIYRKEYFAIYEKHNFDNFKIRIPQKSEELLSIMYGNYTEYPPEEYRLRMQNRTYLIKRLKYTV